MSRNVQSLITLAYKESLKGIHKHQRIGAVLLKGGSVIGKEYNISRPYGDYNRGSHAEERLLNKNAGKTQGATLIVARSNKNGKLCSMSRPCHICYPLVKKSGIKKIIYVDWDEKIVIERVK